MICNVRNTANIDMHEKTCVVCKTFMKILDGNFAYTNYRHLYQIQMHAYLRLQRPTPLLDNYTVVPLPTVSLCSQKT